MAELGRRIRWWQWLALLGKRWRVVIRVDEGDEVPPHLPFRGAVLVGPSREPSWIAFDCPCGKGHRVMLNLSPHRLPRWQVIKSSPLSLAPSVDSLAGGRRCHYWVHKGRVEWVPASGSATWR